MDDRPRNTEAEIARDAAARIPRARRGPGLSWKLLILTLLFVSVSAVLIYVPSIANFRLTWLSDRLAMADTASVVLAAADTVDVPRDIQDQLLAAVGATAIAIRTGSVSRLIAAVEMPPEIDRTVDLRMMEPVADIVAAFETLLAPDERMLRVIGDSRNSGAVELVITDTPLRDAMLSYSVRVLWLAVLISVILSGLLFLSVDRMFVRPMRRLSQNMVAFSDAPDDSTRVITPSGRGDEIGVAEDHLASMQRDLQTTLREQRHLADLGLAVSKINHDLRNMLASAQLFSDRLGGVSDPTVQRFAPKLIAALDRAISYCQTTLAYGRAREAPPSRRLIALDRLVDDVADGLGLVGHQTIAFDNAVAQGMEIDADPDQLFRILVNLGRNAIQALESDSSPALVRRLTISGERRDGCIAIRVDDTGPGIPQAARAHLFQAFQGTVRPGGTGLGLAIAAELARAHGGSVALAEKAGPGACFEIIIPHRRESNGRPRAA
ncbi:Signal transduction histidine kinase [Bauldia litoralis]|uniref:histidine kinase n=1 Tax=Bauldia litoralis TaxID=665467 RepID=A0A1G6E684_9HYPH|nr:Signal transduction histidine kinase [Bauldia litoralis]